MKTFFCVLTLFLTCINIPTNTLTAMERSPKRQKKDIPKLFTNDDFVYFPDELLQQIIMFGCERTSDDVLPRLLLIMRLVNKRTKALADNWVIAKYFLGKEKLEDLSLLAQYRYSKLPTEAIAILFKTIDDQPLTAKNKDISALIPAHERLLYLVAQGEQAEHHTKYKNAEKNACKAIKHKINIGNQKNTFNALLATCRCANEKVFDFILSTDTRVREIFSTMGIVTTDDSWKKGDYKAWVKDSPRWKKYANVPYTKECFKLIRSIGTGGNLVFATKIDSAGPQKSNFPGCFGDMFSDVTKEDFVALSLLYVWKTANNNWGLFKEMIEPFLQLKQQHEEWGEDGDDTRGIIFQLACLFHDTEMAKRIYNHPYRADWGYAVHTWNQRIGQFKGERFLIELLNKKDAPPAKITCLAFDVFEAYLDGHCFFEDLYMQYNEKTQIKAVTRLFQAFPPKQRKQLFDQGTRIGNSGKMARDIIKDVFPELCKKR